MNREWRNGSIQLVDGFTLHDREGRSVSRLDGIRFALEGGFVNIEIPGITGIQVVSAPAVRHITCSGAALR